MDETPDLVPAPRRSNHRGRGRRAVILTAFHECVIEQGYAHTSLADIARRADMSPSHLLYYYGGKDAILAAYFEDVSERILERLDEFRGDTPRKQVDRLCDLFFSGKGITRFEIGFMLECFAVAVHDSQLHRYKSALDRACKAYLQELFRTTRGPETAEDRAEVAYAMLIGLRTAAYFDERLGLPRALELFRSQVYRLAAIPRGDGHACTSGSD